MNNLICKFKYLTQGHIHAVKHVGVFFFVLLCFLATLNTLAMPKPGDVFREYHIVGGGSNGIDSLSWQDDFAFTSHHTGEISTKGNRTFKGIDIEHATKVEFIASHWGGHIGSENRRVIMNDNPAIPLPLIVNTPNSPECYFSQQCQAAAEIPLEYMKQGENKFRLEVGNQICYSFNWGWFWTNQIVLRVYYDPSKVEHPYGEIKIPLDNAVINNYGKITCDIQQGNVERVEVLGKYKDFSWGGSGEFNTWHGTFFMTNTNLQHHIGTAPGRYPDVYWDCRWIPDQSDVKIAARLIDKSGMIYMTEAVENITIVHGSREVKMYTSNNVPENFATQVDSSVCTIHVPDNLDNAFAAKLVVSTFSGGTPDREVHINNVPVVKGGWGVWHRVAFCEEYIPVDILKTGSNEFKIKANYRGEHAFEVNWPGPVLFIEYNK